jgi:hypothetical protein
MSSRITEAACNTQFFIVMAGLDPAIHAYPLGVCANPVDARNKSGHDDGEG